MLNNTKFNPFHISGFTQADGCFHVAISKDSSYKLKLRVTPKFLLSQFDDSISFLENIKTYFDAGHIITTNQRNECNYIVNSLPKIKEKIIPQHFFDKKNGLSSI